MWSPHMLRKALAACAFATILLCVGVFDSAPADAQGYSRYRGGARVGVYRGPRGGVAVRAGYGGGLSTGYYGGRGYGGRELDRSFKRRVCAAGANRRRHEAR